MSVCCALAIAVLCKDAAADSAIVDILSSVDNYLNIKLLAEQQREIDGIPFIGSVSLSNVHIKTKGDSLTVYWNSFVSDEKLKILILYSFGKNSQPDIYEFIRRSKFNCNNSDVKVLFQNTAFLRFWLTVNIMPLTYGSRLQDKRKNN